MRGEGGSRRTLSMAAVWLVLWAVFGLLSSTSGLIEVIRRDLGLTYAQSGFLLSLPFPLIGFFALTGGVFLDRMGVGRLVRLGAALALAGGAVRIGAGSFWSLAAGIALVGAGTGLMYPVLPKLARMASPERRESAAALFTGAVVVGTAMSIAFSGQMGGLWRAAPFSPAGADWRGGYLGWAAVLLAVYALWLAVAAKEGPEDAGREAAGGGAAPSGSLSIWRSRPIWAVTAAFFINNVIFYTSIGWFPSILMEKGWSLAQATFLTSLVPWVAVFGIMLTPALTALAGGPARFMSICGVLTAVSLAAMPFAGAWTAVAVVVVIGLALVFWFVLCMGYPAKEVPAEAAGRAAGMIIGLSYIGGFVGPWAAGIIRDATGGFGTALLALAAAAAVSLFAAPSFGRPAE